MRQAEIACQASARKHSVRNKRRAEGSRAGDEIARDAQRSVITHRWPVGLVRLVVVGVLVAQDIEWTARRDFEDRRDRKV